MSASVHETAGGRVIIVRVSGKLTREDYALWVPRVEELIRTHGKIRILFDMKDFHGWSTSALWQDLKFDLKHFSDIERLAMIGESRWQRGMSWFCWPFTTAEIRYFTREQAREARDWLLEHDVKVESSP